MDHPSKVKNNDSIEQNEINQERRVEHNIDLKHAAGDKKWMWKAGYMLRAVRERKTYNIEDLAYIASDDWVVPTDDEDLILRVADTTVMLCKFLHTLIEAGFEEFIKHIDELLAVEYYVQRFDYLITRPVRPDTLQDAMTVNTIICAETFCTWDALGRSPLPPPLAFVQLFGHKIVVPLTEFTRKLTRAFMCKPFADCIHRHYNGQCLYIMTNFGALAKLVGDN
ncbi:hypothetical protein F5Y19DRAFT_223609 [Xylariaceae sp. FL1651]|nr:hypothetical protein F5Y19DRAFT_223609 [Xylariaceae sp. FL1651]